MTGSQQRWLLSCCSAGQLGGGKQRRAARMRPKVLVNTKDMPRAEWLEWRRKGIGASDAAAVVGLSPWRSAIDVYLDKVNPKPENPEEQNERLLWGRLLEDLIAKEYTRRTGTKVRRRWAILQHPVYQMVICNLDFVCVGGGILECKTTNQYNEHMWRGGDEDLPEYYWIQAQHEMAVTGEPWCDVCVLIGGQELRTKRVERDEEAIEQLLTIAADFWRKYVVPRIPPEPDGTGASTEAVKNLYARGKKGAVIDLPSDTEDLIKTYLEAEKTFKFWSEAKMQAENRLKARLGEAEKGLLNGKPALTWVTIPAGKRFDPKAVKEKYPDVYAECQREHEAYRGRFFVTYKPEGAE